ncbi:MAG: shikimate dehydrogenase [Lysobacter sp.]|nr:MAG: shikimate dehydrogenase [Lysobacter sp.]
MEALRYAVFGHPVAHSRSPWIHAAFAAQFGIELDYARIDASPADFAAALDHFGRGGGRGANVTLPHKAAAAAACTELAPRAQRAGAVNTLIRLDDGIDGSARWRGDNTDGIGLVRDLQQHHGLAMREARVLLIGAGGAAAGIAPALLDAGIGALAITNRNRERLAALEARLADGRVHARPWPAHGPDDDDDDGNGNGNGNGDGDGDGDEAHCPPRHAAAFDIVINATSAARGSDPARWPLPRDLARGWAAVDLGYGAAAASFLMAAREHGAGACIDGLGMLVEQAAESFFLWHGCRPDTGPILVALRD